jgi:sigma-B regulation protein RsbU (phosphoserine phosphatase)
MAGATHPHDLVGGDYYDFVRVTETRIGLAIADVSGKGGPAALIMAGFRMSLLGEIRNEFAIRAVMRKVNSLLYESMDRDKFVTAFYGVLDTKSQVLTFSNAGHNPPTLLRAGGKVEYLEEGGVALGVLPDARYEDRPIALQPGDLLVLYTDGIVEARDRSGAMFGSDRLAALVAAASDEPAEVVARVREALFEHQDSEVGHDDQTLVVVRQEVTAGL